MNRTASALVALATVATASLSTPPSAPAAPPQPWDASAWITYSSPACNTIQVKTIRSPGPGIDQEVYVDGASLPVPGVVHAAAGRHTVHARAALDVDGFDYGAGPLYVRPCSATSPRLLTDGDEDGDGRADVLAVQAGTGDLYYYRSRGTGLAAGVKVGVKWNDTVFMQRVTENHLMGSTRYLYTVRKDGSVWRYIGTGQGHYGHPQRLGSGLSSNAAFAFTRAGEGITNDVAVQEAEGGRMREALMQPTLVARAWGSPVAWTGTNLTLPDGGPSSEDVTLDIRPNGQLWATRLYGGRPDAQVGRGWGAMQLVASPGSLDGDAFSDLIARRADGNLYQYAGSTKGLVHGFGPAQLIGHHWQQVRLLA